MVGNCIGQCGDKSCEPSQSNHIRSKENDKNDDDNIKKDNDDGCSSLLCSLSPECKNYFSVEM